MQDLPLVSVLMPVYNAEKYVSQAIESILNQSYENFELLIFNDGSTDRCKSIIENFDDQRIRLFNSTENSGYLMHLNQGIHFSLGKYIVRADADDINLPERIKKQVSFMEKHPEIGLCGSWIQIISSSGEEKQIVKYFAEDAWIRSHLFWTTAIMHPTVIIRKQILKENALFYQPEWYLVEDYALWIEISKYTQLANIQEPLVQVRKHDQNISVTQKTEQAQKAQRIRMSLLTALKIQPTTAEWQIHMHLIQGSRQSINLGFIKKLDQWLFKLLKQNQRNEVFPVESFRGILRKFWYKHTLGYTKLGLRLWWIFIQSPLSDYNKFGLFFKIKFFIKALFRI